MSTKDRLFTRWCNFVCIDNKPVQILPQHLKQCRALIHEPFVHRFGQILTASRQRLESLPLLLQAFDLLCQPSAIPSFYMHVCDICRHIAACYTFEELGYEPYRNLKLKPI